METDFMSRYFSRREVSSDSRQHRVNGNVDLVFDPSPVKQTHQTDNSGYNNTDSYTNGNTFCHEDNIPECMDYLNQELSALGLPRVSGEQSSQHVHLANTMYELLQRCQRNTHLRQELEVRCHRQEAEVSRLLDTRRNLLQQLDQSQNETAQTQEKERQLAVKNKQLAAKLKAEKEEVKRLLSVIQHRDAQYKHELKKKEREHTKLKDRLHTMLTDKKGTKSGMEISAVLHRSDGKRATWKTGNKQEDELYRQVIGSYEDRQKQLIVENDGLRKCLNDIQQEVIKAFREPSSEENSHLDSSQEMKPKCENVSVCSDESGATDTQDGLRDGHFQMPYEYLEGTLLKTVKTKLGELKKHIKIIEKKRAERKSSPSKAVRDRDRGVEMDRMKKDIERYKDVIDQQENFIQESLQSTDPQNPTTILNEGEILEDKENVEFQKKMFKDQKVEFEKERTTFTDATIRLHREKKKFEEEKIKFLHDQFMQMTPFQTRIYRGFPKSTPIVKQTSKRVLPITPAGCQDTSTMVDPCLQNRTPNQKIPQFSTPTTHDLYRELGLLDSAAKSSRPQTAGALLRDPHTTPPWATSGRPISASAVFLDPDKSALSPSQVSPCTSQAVHMDNIKLMLFRQKEELAADDGDEH